MNSHIVRVNEKIEKIANLYNLTVDEIKKINTHIRDWNNLLPGTKLRLPEISDMLNDEINNVEPFIEEYYPKIDKDIYNKKEENITEINISNENNNHTGIIENNIKNKSHNVHNYPYPYYYNYPYNQYKRVTNRNRKKTK